MNEKFNDALELAIDAHADQIRKGTENSLGIAVPYITHPVAVAALVIRYGGNEDQAIAALLHDVIEDGKPMVDWSGRILEGFGSGVLRIVEGCTDGKPDLKTGQKESWRARKESYLKHLPDAAPDILLVSACDKLHNLQAIHLDLVELGLTVFERFSAEKEDVLWYYRELSRVFSERGVTPAKAIAKEFQAVEYRTTHLC